MKIQFKYPRTMETGEVVNNFKELREHIRVKSERKTLHGIPKTEQALVRYVTNQDLIDNLSKGHLSEKHIREHLMATDCIITGAQRIAEAGQNYVPNRNSTSIEKAAKRALGTSPQQHQAGGSGVLFSMMMRNSPYSVRVRNNVRKVKLIRPRQIVLERLSDVQYAEYKQVKKRNGKGETPKYRKTTKNYVNNGSMKIQVVHPY